jgi:hypothetical protein
MPEKVIHSHVDLAGWLDINLATLKRRHPGMSYVDALESDMSRRVYKGTECGAWLKFVAKGPPGIRVGSIVEGADECTEVIALRYPFTLGDFWGALNAVEKQARDIWNATHGCGGCWPDGGGDEWGNEWLPGQVGNKSVDPDCPDCHGQGIII